MFKATLFIIAKKKKKPKCFHQWVKEKKMGYP